MQALKGEDITIYGDGSQTRSFCYCDHLIEGFIRLMATPDRITGPMNLGNPTEFTIRDLAEIILAMVNSKSQLVFWDLPSDDPKQCQSDIAFAQKELGWNPQVPLREGLAKTIIYFDEFISHGG